MCMCAYAHACVCARARVRVRESASVCDYLCGVHMCVCATTFMYIHILCVPMHFNVYIYIISRLHVVVCTDMGWLRLVGSIKLHFSCAKENYERDNILQKRRII